MAYFGLNLVEIPAKDATTIAATPPGRLWGVSSRAHIQELEMTYVRAAEPTTVQLRTSCQ